MSYPLYDEDRPRCSTPTSNLRQCQHAPRYCYLRGGIIIYAQCSQHYRSKGHARMLAPRWWEFDAVLDLASGVTTDLRGIAPEGMSR